MTISGGSDAAVYETARHAVEDLLKLKGFIDAQWDKIETRLMGAETRADDTEKQVAKAEAAAAEAKKRTAEAKTPDAEAEAVDAEAKAVAAEAEAKSAAQSANVVFFAECLPYAAAIVHTGSVLKDFGNAKAWATQRQPQPADAVSVLAVLTFFYLVDRGTKLSAEKDSQELLKWESIRRRVNNLLKLDGIDTRQPPGSAASSGAVS